MRPMTRTLISESPLNHLAMLIPYKNESAVGAMGYPDFLLVVCQSYFEWKNEINSLIEKIDFNRLFQIRQNLSRG